MGIKGDFIDKHVEYYKPFGATKEIVMSDYLNQSIKKKDHKKIEWWKKLTNYEWLRMGASYDGFEDSKYVETAPGKGELNEKKQGATTFYKMFIKNSIYFFPLKVAKWKFEFNPNSKDDEKLYEYWSEEMYKIKQKYMEHKEKPKYKQIYRERVKLLQLLAKNKVVVEIDGGMNAMWNTEKLPKTDSMNPDNMPGYHNLKF